MLCNVKDNLITAQTYCDRTVRVASIARIYVCELFYIKYARKENNVDRNANSLACFM